MGKYVNYKVAGYWIYYTMKCLGEGIVHVHANSKTIKKGAAKIWVHSDGTSTVADYGIINARDMNEIQEWIKNNMDIIMNEWFVVNSLGARYKDK